ncbi:MAG: outer membrane protein assembly factor BamE [Pseudomonadota bacterium]
MISQHFSRALRHLSIVLATVTLFGCSWLEPHRIEITQGNVLERDTVEKVEIGMSREQVRFLLGAPAVADLYHPNRWDYVEYNDIQDEPVFIRRLTLHFDGQELVRMEREGDWSARKAPSEADKDDVMQEPNRPGAPEDGPLIPRPEDERP